MKFYVKKKVALVLGGGAARGLAHLGILKVFRREDIRFDFVIGTSIGALFAAIWTLELDLVEAEEKALRLTARDILDVTISRTGLCKGNKLEYLIKEILKNNGFENIKIPLFIVTTDIGNGSTVIHSSGDLVKVVRASCSIPGIFMPVEIEDRIIVDGGIVNNVPVSIAKKYGATHVVAVDIGYCIRQSGINNMLNTIIQSIQVMGERLNRYETKGADIILRPELDGINQTEFDRVGEIIQKGEIIAERFIAKVKRLTTKRPLGISVGFLWE